MMKSIWLLFVCAVLAHSAVTNVRVQGTTSTQAIIAYTAPTQAACTVEVSESASYSPLVHAVDTALFPGASGDGGGNTARIFVAGKRTVGTGTDGRKYSLALQAFTTHYFRVTCETDQATGNFQTTNIPFGSTRQDSLEADPDQPGEYLLPSPKDSVIDPKTGAQLNRISSVYGDAIAGTTGAAGYSFAAATSPTGEWSNPSNVLANDSNLTTATAQGWLWVRLAGQYPDNSTFTSNQLSFQNLSLTGYCSGADCATGGQTLEVCVTRFGIDEDGAHCEQPIKRIDMPSSNGSVTICNDSGNCSSQNRPGDMIAHDTIPKDSWRVSNGGIYNAGYGSNGVFTDAKDCRKLFVNETLQFYISNGGYTQYPVISSLNCAANPPSIEFSQGIDLSHNSTAGVPYYFRDGIAGNPRYGFLIRKANGAASSTINLNYANWRAASYVSTTFGWGSGGFGQTCTKKATANGFYHCFAGNSKLYAIRTEGDGSLTVRFMGIAYFSGQMVTNGGVPSGLTICTSGLNDFLWDAEDPNRFYCNSSSSQKPGAVLVSGLYTGNDVAAPLPDPMNENETVRWPRLPATYTNLTPCVGSCSSDNDDYTLLGQAKRYAGTKTPAFDTAEAAMFSRCSIESIQGDSAIMACRLYQQDSFTWLFALDLGNRLPIGGGFVGSFGNTQHVIAANPMHARRGSRFCTLHTYQNPQNPLFAVPEFQDDKEFGFKIVVANSLPTCNKGGAGNCAACPAITVDGYDYTGKNYCGTIQLSSTSLWSAGWGTAPPEGTPVRNNNSGTPANDILHQFGPPQVGDVIRLADNCEYGRCEFIKLLQQTSATTWVVERAFSDDQSAYPPRAHSAEQTHAMVCVNNPNRGNIAEGATWYFLEDPDATGWGTTYLYSNFVNHALTRNNFRLTADYHYSRADFADKTAIKQTASEAVGRIGIPGTFSSVAANAEGNAVEKHPSYNQFDAPAYDQTWFLDAHPYLFATNQNGNSTHVSGQLWKYAYNGQINPKFYDIAAFVGQSVSRDISGPGSSLTGAAADSYKHCYASIAGECYAGSAVGDLYMNVPGLDVNLLSCRESEFYGGWRDLCATNFNAIGASYVQWGMPPADGYRYRNGSSHRVITRGVRFPYRGSATENWKATPDGRWGMLRNEYIVKLPPLPSQDSVVRDEFIPVLMYLKPPEGLGAVNAIVEFGYDALFRCTERDEACVANSAAIDATNPFRFGSESGWNGLACANGCTIAIPAISQRVLYYRVLYRNAAGQVLAASGTNVTTTP